MPDPSFRTVHLDPALDGTDRSAEWEAGLAFPDWLPSAEKNVGLWTSTWERARVPDETVARAENIPGEWRLLVLSADWCGDASNTIPVLARLAERASNVQLRLLERDEHPALMDDHLTNGTSRSIPAVIVLDGEGRERGWWGPRPADLQAWVKTRGMEMDPADRYREVRKWYARDRGQMTLGEVVGLMETAGGSRTIG